MKKLLLFLAIFSVSLLAQEITNAGFENWTQGSNGYDPDGWFTLDFLWDATQRSTDAHSGTYAAKMMTIDFSGSIETPIMYSYTPATQTYGSLNGYYKFAPSRVSDVFSISVIMYKGSSLFGIVGGNQENWKTNTAVSSFTQFTVPIEYFSSETPDSAWIIFSLDDTAETMAAGAYVIIDDLSWGSVVGVNNNALNIPAKFDMQQNYPNPFNPSTRIDYTLPEASFVQLKVYDIVGNEVATLVNEYQPAGRFRAEFNAANLSSGIYIAKLTTGSFTKTMKMTLLK
ncbi:MAG TPA: T9SS type A sorting domain-containing protein [Ignavibacteriaceae bacterium]|nr:T9SS type A sorting domain-containing protein [Ignavibacteriaceae bacterium]